MASDAVMNSIIAQGRRLATHSWEYGTFAEALIEWYHPQYSVFGSDAFPGGKVPVLKVEDTPSLAYAKPHIWTNATTLVDGDGSAGDPASLGVSAILIGQTQPEYLAAAGRQVEHLLATVPRWPNGAISHREDVAELWADSVYMAPPLLAYWGAQAGNASVLAAALEQGALYGEALGVPAGAAGAGLWRHIAGPQSADPGLWSTGNAWAAAGLARVLATAQRAPPPLAGDPAVRAGAARARAAARALLDGALAADAAAGPAAPLLRNYLDDPTWFGELSGTTLLAAAAYRLARLAPAEFAGPAAPYTAWADAKRAEVLRRIGPDGLLAPVVNPLNWGDRTPGTESPEAQSFAVLLFAAYRDYQEACTA